METQLEKAKRLRGKCVQYMYSNSKHRFEALTKIVYKLQDEANEIRRKQIKEHENTIAHNWLMASKGLNGKQILIHTK
jgi:hypothetical protein